MIGGPKKSDEGNRKTLERVHCQYVSEISFSIVTIAYHSHGKKWEKP